VGVYEKILYGLKSKKIISIDEGTLVKNLGMLEEGMRVKVVKRNDILINGWVYKIVRIGKSINNTNYYIFNKINKDGNLASSSSRDNHLYVNSTVVDRLINSGCLMILGEDEGMKDGEIKVEDIKRIIVNLGIRDEIKLPMNRLVSSSGPYIQISFGEGDNVELMVSKVKKALENNKIKFVEYSRGFRGKSIWLDKNQ
jgi:hypothetical protein